MSKDFLTTIFGMIAAAAYAGKEYIVTNGDISGGQFWLGVGGAVAMALWAYHTNKK